jgi:GNAT superfamily N-acetyltransferase
MSNVSGPFIFFQVTSGLAVTAFEFHNSIASHNEHIWPRNEEQIRQYAQDGYLFAVRMARTDEFVGLCYVIPGDSTCWEVGGLAVADEARKFHLGSVLVRFALAHTIAYQSPWRYGQKIIAHVHESNEKPRNLLKLLGFEFSKPVQVSGKDAPASMKRNSEGNVCGDEFDLPRKAVIELQEWFERDTAVMLADGETVSIFDVPPGGLDGLRESLREEVADFKGQK